MDLQTMWFVLIAVLFAGYFLLEGFDFGVGMLLPFVGKQSQTPATSPAEDPSPAEAVCPARHRNAAIKAIGPVWDGNEVWLITAGGALFAAFPEWYATMFSGFYLPLFLILIGLILRGVSLEWRGKVDTQQWRDRCDLGIGFGSWIPAILWGVAFGNIVRGVAIDQNRQIDSGFDGLFSLLNPYALLSGLTFVLVFLVHGAIFLGLKAEEPLRTSAHTLAKRLAIPTLIVATGFTLWTQLLYGKPLTWLLLGVFVCAALAGVFALWKGRDGLAFSGMALAVVAFVFLLFACLFPNVMPTTLDDGISLDIYNASSSHYTLKMMTWAALIITPFVIGYQAWTYWVFRKRVAV